MSCVLKRVKKLHHYYLYKLRLVFYDTQVLVHIIYSLHFQYAYSNITCRRGGKKRECLISTFFSQILFYILSLALVLYTNKIFNNSNWFVSVDQCNSKQKTKSFSLQKPFWMKMFSLTLTQKLFVGENPSQKPSCFLR